METESKSLTQRVVEVFLHGNLAPMLILVSLLAGAVALAVTPREEEPQIVVPLADVYVSVPGASAEEVERQVATRLEKLLYQIDGVEYVYSMSRAHEAVITVRFYVGEDREDSLVKLHNKLQMNVDQIPRLGREAGRGRRRPDPERDAVLGRARRRRAAPRGRGARALAPGRAEHRPHRDPRRPPARAARRGRARGARGARRVVDGVEASAAGRAGARARRQPRPARRARPRRERQPAARRRGPRHAGRRRQRRDPDLPAGRRRRRRRLGRGRDPHADRFWSGDRRHGPGRVPRPGQGLAGRDDRGREEGRQRGLGRARRPGTRRAPEGGDPAQRCRGALHARPRRDRERQGQRDRRRALGCGRDRDRADRAGARLARGLDRRDRGADHVRADAARQSARGLFDQPRDAVRADARARARRRRSDRRRREHPPAPEGGEEAPAARGRRRCQRGPPADHPRDTGGDGQLPAAVLHHRDDGAVHAADGVERAARNVHESRRGVHGHTLASYHVLRRRDKAGAGGAGTSVARESEQEQEQGQNHDDELAIDQGSTMYRAYSGVLRPLLQSRRLRWAALAVTGLLFVGSGWLAMGRHVPLKMLPYDNKNELQVVIDMPEGTTLERTEAVTAELAARVRGFAEVTDVTSFAGRASAIDFNGMVRHHYLREGPHLADLRVNLLHKEERALQSHAFAQGLRRALQPLADASGARLQILEPPAGPPVVATITVEVYGPVHAPYGALLGGAERVRERLAREPGVVDADTTAEAPQPLLRFVLDREKAALHRVSQADVTELLRAAVGGERVATVHAAREVQPLAIVVRLPRAKRSARVDLERLRLLTPAGDSVPLAEIGGFVEGTREQTIYHKNLRRVAYVFAEVDGRAPAEAILDVRADRDTEQPRSPGTEPRPVSGRTYFANGGGIPWSVAPGIELDWAGEGEWKITLDVFRDLGLAFLAACIGIYVLLVHETKSYLLPLILMLSIPFTIIGILPGFWLLQAFAASPIEGAASPVFFTATAMIGMIALSGIAVRNAILLIEFLHRSLERGATLQDAILRSGAVRFRPIFLTAGTAMLAAVPITLDPIFSGLAWALIFGLLVSSAFTLVLVPMVYWMVYGRQNPSPRA